MVVETKSCRTFMSMKPDETVINEGVNARKISTIINKKAGWHKALLYSPTALITVNLKTYFYDVKEKSNPWARLKYWQCTSVGSYY